MSWTLFFASCSAENHCCLVMHTCCLSRRLPSVSWERQTTLSRSLLLFSALVGGATAGASWKTICASAGAGRHRSAAATYASFDIIHLIPKPLFYPKNPAIASDFCRRLGRWLSSDIEGDGHPLAFAERPSPMPGVGGEEDEPPRLGLDRAKRRQVDGKIGRLGLSQREDPGFAFPAVRREEDVEGRTDPARRVDVVGVEALVVQEDRPCAREVDRVALPAEQRVALVHRREFGDMLGHGRADRLAQLNEDRIDVHEQVAVRLGATAQRLFERLATERVELSQLLRDEVDRRQSVGNVVNADERFVAFQPAPAWLVDLPPGERQIGPEQEGVGPFGPALADLGGELR